MSSPVGEYYEKVVVVRGLLAVQMLNGATQLSPAPQPSTAWHALTIGPPEVLGLWSEGLYEGEEGEYVGLRRRIARAMALRQCPVAARDGAAAVCSELGLQQAV